MSVSLWSAELKGVSCAIKIYKLQDIALSLLLLIDLSLFCCQCQPASCAAQLWQTAWILCQTAWILCIGGGAQLKQHNMMWYKWTPTREFVLAVTEADLLSNLLQMGQVVRA